MRQWFVFFFQKNDKSVLDHLFGKCVSILNTSSVKTVWEISMLSALEDVFHMFPEGLDWKDLQVQCLFRTILQGKSDLLTETELKALCGVLPVIAADAPDNEEAEYSLLAKRMFDSEVSVETLLDNNHAGLLPFYSTNEKHNPTSSVFNDRALSAKLVQILKNNRMAKRINHPESNDRTDAEIKQILAQIQLLENESNRHIEFQPVNRPYSKQTG
ncbi:hypothetical protein P879_05775 [Paragonimus westermani]|uniref:Uncharacterized protein n=1 Tax=Paragonimus westermani TaxID=34504 RepID=A0A8T0DWB4_9TREM|nr:hypothetical protein P879_05775 [Paragonimus westermani]